MNLESMEEDGTRRHKAMASCLWVLLRRKKGTIQRPQSNYQLPYVNRNRTIGMDLRRLDSVQSWSTLLERNIGGERPVEGSPPWTADMSELFIGNRFASGASSRIYRGIYKERAVAVKMVKVPHGNEELQKKIDKQFDSEVRLLSRLHHPNIVEFIAAHKKPPVYCIITDYMSQGTLKMYLHKKEPYSLPTKMILKLALDISRGMEYLHSQGVIHRDLKSDNLLLNDAFDVKVNDFGTSTQATKCHDTEGFMGTYRWMAPEMIKGKPYTKKVDVYSFGVVLWEILTALTPFQGMTPIQAAYAVSDKNERPHIPDDCCPAISTLIKQCWSKNPSKRPDFSTIVLILERMDELLKNNLPLVPIVSYDKQVLFQRLKRGLISNSCIVVQA